jgi:diphthamide biosynthesis protein 2
MADWSGVVRALQLAQYKRIAVQVDDSKLTDSASLMNRLSSELPEAQVSLLGDSVTDCCLDETSAEHYGSDCIVKVGHCCWFASQRLVAYFVPEVSVSPEQLLSQYSVVRSENPDSAIFLFVDSAGQLLSIRSALSASSDKLVFTCLSPALSYIDSNKRPLNMAFRRPYASVGIGPVSKLYQKSQPEYPRVAGRLVFQLVDGEFRMVTDPRELDLYLDVPSTSYITTSVNSLYNRLVNRFGTRPGRVSVCSDEAVDLPKSNYKELLRRYKGVEAVKNASSVGLVVMHSAASVELFKVRDILSLFLRSLGKDVFNFSIGKPDGVKLGNFIDVDCFVIMSCPESEYFESDDLVAYCVSPFEALVAVESLDWSDHVITDYDEMLARMVMDPPPRTPRTPRRRRSMEPDTSLNESTKLAPARIEMGLRGIPSRYVSEPPRM